MQTKCSVYFAEPVHQFEDDRGYAGAQEVGDGSQLGVSIRLTE
jgi:hypothetical protein